MIQTLIAGLTLGFASGIAPGPLLTLVISETLQHGRKSGFYVSLAPLITDAPIILTIYFFLSLFNSPFYLSVIQLLGTVYIFYLGLKNLTFTAQTDLRPSQPSHSLIKAITVNFLNPNPYLFWSTVGGPILKQAAWIEGCLFLVLFYVIIVSCKLLLAYLVSRSRPFLNSNTYLWIIRSTGLLLMVFALLLGYRGILSVLG